MRSPKDAEEIKKQREDARVKEVLEAADRALEGYRGSPVKVFVSPDLNTRERTEILRISREAGWTPTFEGHYLVLFRDETEARRHLVTGLVASFLKGFK